MEKVDDFSAFSIPSTSNYQMQGLVSVRLLSTNLLPADENKKILMWKLSLRLAHDPSLGRCYVFHTPLSKKLE